MTARPRAKVHKLLALVVVAGLVLLGSNVIAQGQGIGITPAIEELVLEEGQESVELKIAVMNSTDADVLLGVSTLDFGALDDSGGIAFLGRTEQEVLPRGLSQWMRLDKESVRLEPGQTDEVTLTIQNSTDLSPGGHYGAVVVASESDNPSDSDSVAMQPAASTLVLLKKRGGENFSLELESQKTNNSFVRLPKSTEIRFKNTGNVHVVPRGTVELVSPFGSTIRKGVINEASAYVLPDSSRNYQIEMSRGGEPWLPGRYKLVTQWRFDGQEIFNQTVEYRWYIGWLPIVLFIALCLFIVRKLYKNYKSWDS